jgi:hypothetical protein
MTAWLMLVVTTAYALTSVAMYFSNRQMAHAAQRQAIAAIKQAEAATQQIAVSQLQLEAVQKQTEAALKQIEESKRQFKENMRARVIPKLEVVKDRILYLTFHNIGRTIATNLKIEISPDWLECLKNGPFHSSYVQLSQLCAEEQCLLIDAKCTAQICDLFDAETFRRLCEIPLEIKISFTSGKELFEKVYSPSIALMKPSAPMLVG